MKRTALKPWRCRPVPAVLMAGTRMLVLSVLALPALAHALDTAPVERVSGTRERVLDGVIEAVNESTVSAQVAGRIVEVAVDVDDYVPEDTVIVRFRDKEQRARVAEAEAARDEALARRANARTDFQRVSDLFERRLVSQADYDQAQAELRSAEARVEAATAALEQAREQLEHTVVRAPYSGIVTQRHVEVGESTTVGQPLLTGFSLEKLRARVEVPQRLIEPLRRIGQARVLLDGVEQCCASDESITIFPYADASTNTFTVRVDLPPEIEGLFPGMLVKVAFNVGSRQYLAVPAGTVVRRSEVTGVYVVEGERITFRQVRIGHESDGMVEVLAGLSEGEQVALDPLLAQARQRRRAADDAVDE